MKKYPKVLIGTPTYEGKEYCREKFVENIKKINYPNFHWVIVDNTQKPRYFHKLRRLYPRNVARVPRGNNSRDALANASNYLRKKVIEEGYDYLLMIESDLFPPPNVIWKLLSHGKSVVGFPYEIGFGAGRGLCAFVLEQKKPSIWGTRRVTKQEAHQLLDGSLRQIHGMGVGCVLISREICERFPFWYSSLDDERMAGDIIRKHPDVYFYLDLHNNGVRVFMDTSVLVPHENSDWTKVADV